MIDMIKKNRGKLIISSIVILLPMLAGLILWNELPDRLASHWNFGGEADRWGGRVFEVFVVPCLILVIHWVCILISFADSGNRNQNGKLWKLTFWMCPALSLYVSGIMYSAALGMDGMGIQSATMAFFGLLFIIIGNYMPKCRQNRTIGIKVVWTLRSEENWNRTHRFCGKLWAACGVIFMLSVFLPQAVKMIILPLSFVPAIIAPFIYSFVFYRKQCRDGFDWEAEKGKTNNKYNGENKRKSKGAKIAIAINIAVIAVILAGAAWLLFSGNIAVEYGDSSFAIEADYWKDLEVRYDLVDSVEYRAEDDRGFRTSGFGSARLLMGTFENDEFGRYTRYSYTGCKSCVVLKSENETLVVNGKNDEETKKIYDMLSERCR